MNRVKKGMNMHGSKEPIACDPQGLSSTVKEAYSCCEGDRNCRQFCGDNHTPTA